MEIQHRRRRRALRERGGWLVECVGSVSRENGRVIKSIGALWPVGAGARPGGSERERNVYSTEGMMRNATAKGIGNYEWFLRWSFPPHRRKSVSPVYAF